MNGVRGRQRGLRGIRDGAENSAFPGDSLVEAEDETFVIRTDQMVIWGGQGVGPTPFNLFLAALGMCSGMELLAF